MSQQPETLDDLILRQALGEPLSAAERERLEQALASDPTLRARASELAQSFNQVGMASYEAPPAALRARVLGDAAKVGAAAPVRTSAPATPRRWPMRLAAGIAVLSSGLAVLLWNQNQQLQRDGARQQAAARLLLEPNVVMRFELTGRDAAQSAIGTVLLDLDARRASIVAQGLPALPAGQSYYLWAQLQGQRVPCGHFRVRPDGSLLAQFPIPVDSYTSPILNLLMTVEQDADPDAAQGTVVMVSG